jgi:hypothetical protein
MIFHHPSNPSSTTVSYIHTSWYIHCTVIDCSKTMR